MSRGSEVIEEDKTFEKVAILPRESFIRSLSTYLNRELRLIYTGLHSAFYHPLTLSKWIFWSKSVDRGIRPEAQWYELKGKPENGVGILVCHGFASTPEIFRDVAPKLQNLGYRVRVIRLSGHGTSPGHLAQTSGAEWFASVVWHYQELTKDCERIFFLGHSLGGTLGLLLATIYPIETVIAMCAPVQLHIPPARFVRQASLFVKYWPRSKSRRRFIQETGIQTYMKTPLYAIAGIFEVGTVLRNRAEYLDIPILYVRAGLDHKSLLDQPERLKEHFPNVPITIKEAKNSQHTLLFGPERDQGMQWIEEWFENAI
ncbi:MAG: alpha/beta hydrolase [Candidatus Kariarchaeaceae archaeon]|jgi:carboxylesterase